MSPDPRAVAMGVLSGAGLGALATLGPGPAGVAAGVAVLGTCAPWLRGRLGPRALAVLDAAFLVGVVSAGLAGVDRAVLLAVLLAALLLVRLLRRPLLADRVPVVLATLSLLVVAARTDAPLVLAFVAAHALAVPVALVSSRPSAAVVGGLTVAGGALATVLFLVAPRLVRTDDADRTGMADHVELGALDALLDDPAVVFRARVMPPTTEVPFWRGRAHDTFDGRTWTSSTAETPIEVAGPRLIPADAHVVELVSSEPTDVVFTTGRVVDLLVEGAPLRADGSGGFRATDARRWRMVSLPPLGPSAAVAWDDDPGDLARATTLPADLDPRIAALAREVAGDGPPADQVARLADHLRRNYRYTRRPRDRGAEAPLNTFLFETRAGHCEYFASALAILARTVGTPSRVVNGFAGGSPDPDDGWLEVRGTHAHAWAEVWLDGGWRLVDATPGPVSVAAPALVSDPSSAFRLPLRDWYERVFLSYDRGDQLGALFALSRRLEGGAAVADAVPWRGLGALGAASLLVALGIRRLVRRTVPLVLDPPRPPADPVDRAHARARRHLSAEGLEPPPQLPPVEAAQWAAERRPGDETEALLALAWLLYEVRLGGGDARSAAPRARALADRVCGRVSAER